jgi:Amt family ammonium transporter
VLGWIVPEWLTHKKPTTLGAASGAVAGLVGITPAAGFVGAMPAIVIGLAAGFLCYYGVQLKNKLGYDDALDVVGVHGVGGTTGAILTGVFAGVSTNPDYTGLLAGNAGQMVPQIVGVLAAWALSFIVSIILFKVIDAVIGLRVDEDEEETGLDLALHAETGYIM